MSSEKTLANEKTPASGKQILTMAGGILTCLSPVSVDSETAQFWIDNPKALKYRSALFARRPTVVHVIGYRLGEARGLATLIEAWWSEKFNVFPIDTFYDTFRTSIWIHQCADIVVVDTGDLYSLAVKELEKDGRNFTTEILFVNNYMDIIPIAGENVHVCKNNHEALQWVGNRQIKKITEELECRMSEFVGC